MSKKLNRILLIDDDEPTNVLNTTLLEEAGCAEHIEAVETAQAALRYLSTECQRLDSHDCKCPDLIFLDINMPAMNGWEFMERYSKLSEELHQRTRVVMLTTSINPEDRLKAGKIPWVADFETKPITEEKLDRILGKHFPSIFAVK